MARHVADPNSKLTTTPLPRILCNTTTVIRESHPDATGAVWKLPMRRRDLDSNVIRPQPGASIGAHIGPDLDVLLLILTELARSLLSSAPPI
jgi:hypothetical protein